MRCPSPRPSPWVAGGVHISYPRARCPGIIISETGCWQAATASRSNLWWYLVQPPMSHCLALLHSLVEWPASKQKKHAPDFRKCSSSCLHVVQLFYRRLPPSATTSWLQLFVRDDCWSALSDLCSVQVKRSSSKSSLSQILSSTSKFNCSPERARSNRWIRIFSTYLLKFDGLARIDRFDMDCSYDVPSAAGSFQADGAPHHLPIHTLYLERTF